MLAVFWKRNQRRFWFVRLQASFINYISELGTVHSILRENFKRVTSDNIGDYSFGTRVLRIRSHSRLRISVLLALEFEKKLAFFLLFF